VKLEAEVRKALGLVTANAVPAGAPTNGAAAAQGKVATMPTAAPEAAKVPARR
jgi:hypothetical protein